MAKSCCFRIESMPSVYEFFTPEETGNSDDKNNPETCSGLFRLDFNRLSAISIGPSWMSSFVDRS